MTPAGHGAPPARQRHTVQENVGCGEVCLTICQMSRLHGRISYSCKADKVSCSL